MTALTTRDALKRELQRHIGAHADIVANALIASGAVRVVATLAYDEALVEAIYERTGHLPQDEAVKRIEAVLRALAAALAERGTR